MNPWTLSLLLLVTVCCSILVEVTSGLENDDAEAKAVEDIREKLLAAGMKARSRRFMKRARTRFEKRRENRKEHHGRKDLPRRRGEYDRGYGGRRGGYGRG
ncbi:PREDICTED: sperm protamine P1-like isoform X2 [Branchiostoma belcheri]|uniref:Sperm protamine P1-like isoform X2 n=1 Tax=Branchiostoma belcheri TaxID=7741 RepID=A0A6P4YE20_BRABE|nr:PREDICTED: sperm protamine P1-like isoform X2 [Branchiostoma belcheri]